MNINKEDLIRTLLQNTQTIILDEPEKSLDAVSIHNLHELLIELKREHLVIIRKLLIKMPVLF